MHKAHDMDLTRLTVKAKPKHESLTKRLESSHNFDQTHAQKKKKTSKTQWCCHRTCANHTHGAANTELSLPQPMRNDFSPVFSKRKMTHPFPSCIVLNISWGPTLVDNTSYRARLHHLANKFSPTTNSWDVLLESSGQDLRIATKSKSSQIRGKIHRTDLELGKGSKECSWS